MKIAVYCSSSNKISAHYRAMAAKLGEWIGEQQHTLVYGGATGGLMSAVSDAASSKNAEIIGVISNAIVRMNRQSGNCTQLFTVESMSDRKASMLRIADVFVVLPGSFGTLDEMFDVVSSAIVGEHKKPLIVVNEMGFYDDLIQLINKMHTQGFITVDNYKAIFVDNIEACIELINKLAEQK
jgi:uncharacterized protein (TIGR00730 family)